MSDLLFKLLEFTSKGYRCSQILLLLGLGDRHKENPDLVRSMAGLCLENGGRVCGILSGAACFVALYSGKGGDLETENEKMSAMLQELTDWFTEYTTDRYDGIECKQIKGDIPDHPDMSRCGELITDTYRMMMEILVSNGYDPFRGPCEWQKDSFDNRMAVL